MQSSVLMEPREWQRLSVPIETLYDQMAILQSRIDIASSMGKGDMVAGLQRGIDRLEKIIAYRLAHDNNENTNDE